MNDKKQLQNVWKKIANQTAFRVRRW